MLNLLAQLEGCSFHRSSTRVNPRGMVETTPAEWKKVADFSISVGKAMKAKLVGVAMIPVVVPGQPMVCSICKKHFKTERGYKSHCINAHVPSSRVVCDQQGVTCVKSFTTKSHMNRHKKRAHKFNADGTPVAAPEKPTSYRCTFPGCDVVVEKIHQLSVHSRKDHAGQGPEKCPWCDHHSKNKKALSDHKRYCRENPLFEWKRCSAVFPGCLKKFSKASDLQQHMINDHGLGQSPQ